MPGRTVFNYQEGFGGLWSAGTQSEAPDKSAQVLQNAKFVSGGFQTINGWQRIVRTKLVGRIRTLYDYQDGTNQHVLGTHNDELVEWNGTTGAGGTWTVLKTGFSVENVPTNLGFRFSMVTAYRRCYMQNGVDAGQIYDGTDVFDWGLPAPLTAPTVAGQSGTFENFNGEMEEFHTEHYFFKPGDSDVGSLPHNNRVPDNWTNVNRTGCFESADAFSGLRSVQLWSGKEDKLFLTAHLDQPTTKLDFDVGLNALSMQLAANDKNPEWNSYYHGRGYWVGRNIIYTKGGAGESLEVASTTAIVIGLGTVTLVDPSPVDSAGLIKVSEGWNCIGGPFDGELSFNLLDHPEFPLGVGGDMSFSAQIKTELAAGELEIELVGDSSGSTIISSAVVDAYEQLTGTHTFTAADVSAEIILRVKDQSPNPWEPLDSFGLFDEVRVVAGSTPPGPGGDLEGTFKYKCVFVDSAEDGGDGTFSPIGPESDNVTVTAGVIELTNIPQPPGAVGEHPSTDIYIYRAHSQDGGDSFTLFNFVGKVAIGVTTFSDTVPQVEAETNALCKDDIIVPPRGRWLVFHEGRMVVAGDISVAANADDQQTIFFTDPLDAGAFRTRNKIKLPLRDNDGITGLAVNHDRLYVFTRDSIFQILFLGIPGQQRILPVSTGIGCYDGHTIAIYESLVFFEGPAAIYAMNAQNQFTKISSDIKLSVDRDFDPSIDRFGVIFQNRYAIQGNISQIYVYDIEEGGKWTFISNGQQWSHVGSIQEINAAFPETLNRLKLYMSDVEGYTYASDPDFYAAGVQVADSTLTGNPTSGTVGGGQTTLTDTGATFLVDEDDLEQLRMEIVRKDSKGNILNTQFFVILSNTATVLTLDGELKDEDGNSVAPATTDFYRIAPIVLRWVSKAHDMGNTGVDKKLKRVAAKVVDLGGDVTAVDIALGCNFSSGRVSSVISKVINKRWIRCRGKGRTLAFTIIFNEPGARVRIEDFQAEYSPRSNRIRGG